MQTDKKNCFFCVRNEITFDFVSYLLSRNNLTMSSPITNTTLNSLSLFQKCYFTAWFGTDLFLVVERSKDITHVKLLLSLVAKIVYLLFTCEIHDTRHLHAAQFCVCLVETNSQAVPSIVCSLQNGDFERFGGFCVDSYCTL